MNTTHTDIHSRSLRMATAVLVTIVVLLTAGAGTAHALVAGQTPAGAAAANGAGTAGGDGGSTAPTGTGNGAGANAGAGAGANAGAGAGAQAGAGAGGINVSIDTGSGQNASTAVQVLVVMTVLTLAPSILIMMTGFTRILIVLGFVRNALGTPTMPPNQVLIGLSLFLTMFVMFPTFSAINKEAIQPWQDKAITQEQAIEKAQQPLREFMFKQVDEKDLALFVRLADMERPETRADVPTHVLIPAFLISELTTAFEIGFLIFIPFLIIDMVVASTLMSMGMIMLPPVMISLPFKILLFVLVDGWALTVQSIVLGFGPPGG